MKYDFELLDELKKVREKYGNMAIENAGNEKFNDTFDVYLTISDLISRVLRTGDNVDI